MSSGSKGDTDNPITDILSWLCINVAVAIAVGFLYGLVSFPFIYASAMAGGPDKVRHMILWVAGYGAISGGTAGVFVQDRIKETLVFWAITVVSIVAFLWP